MLKRLNPKPKPNTRNIGSRLDRMVKYANLAYVGPRSRSRRRQLSGSSSVVSHEQPKTPLDSVGQQTAAGRNRQAEPFNLLSHAAQALAANQGLLSSSSQPHTSTPAWLSTTLKSLDEDHPLRQLMPYNSVADPRQTTLFPTSLSARCLQKDLEEDVDDIFAFKAPDLEDTSLDTTRQQFDVIDPPQDELKHNGIHSEAPFEFSRQSIFLNNPVDHFNTSMADMSDSPRHVTGFRPYQTPGPGAKYMPVIPEEISVRSHINLPALTTSPSTYQLAMDTEFDLHSDIYATPGPASRISFPQRQYNDSIFKSSRCLEQDNNAIFSCVEDSSEYTLPVYQDLWDDRYGNTESWFSDTPANLTALAASQNTMPVTPPPASSQSRIDLRNAHDSWTYSSAEEATFHSDPYAYRNLSQLDDSERDRSIQCGSEHRADAYHTAQLQVMTGNSEVEAITSLSSINNYHDMGYRSDEDNTTLGTENIEPIGADCNDDLSPVQESIIQSTGKPERAPFAPAPGIFLSPLHSPEPEPVPSQDICTMNPAPSCSLPEIATLPTIDSEEEDNWPSQQPEDETDSTIVNTDHVFPGPIILAPLSGIKTKTPERRPTRLGSSISEMQQSQASNDTIESWSD